MFAVAEICKEAGGWTYEEYLEQPRDLIDAILVKMRVSASLQERENQKMQSEMVAMKAKGAKNRH